MTIEAKIHMGEIIEAMERLLRERGFTPASPIRFRYATGRAVEIGRDTLLNESGSYLTAVCDVVPTKTS